MANSSFYKLKINKNMIHDYIKFDIVNFLVIIGNSIKNRLEI